MLLCLIANQFIHLDQHVCNSPSSKNKENDEFRAVSLVYVLYHVINMHTANVFDL